MYWIMGFVPIITATPKEKYLNTNLARLLVCRDHIRISLVIDAVSERTRHGLNIINLSIVIYFLGALGYGAAIQAQKALAVMERTGTASDLPLPVTLKSLLVIGVVLMLLQAIVQLGRTLRRRA